MHRNAVAVIEAASRLGLAIDVREFPAGTRTAADAAEAIGVDVGQIVKSLVFAVGDAVSEVVSDRTSARIVVALVSGRNQLDEAKLAAAASTARSWRVDADAVREATGYPVGGVPPLGHATALDTYIDSDLCAYDVVWAAAGTPMHVFAITPTALTGACGAVRADLRKAIPA